jgi:hypothetical protein
MRIVRTFVLATILLFGSTAAFASESDQRNDPKAFNIHKAKDEGKNKDEKDKKSAPVSVPDGGASTGLLLTIVGAGAAAWSLAARWQHRVDPSRPAISSMR